MASRRKHAALLATFAVAAAGCGGGGGDGAGAGADVAPASSAAFISIANDPKGEQWQAAEELLARFPGGRDALADFHDELEEEGIDFERDVRPALGPEVDVVVLDVPSGDEAQASVLLTQPPDEERLRELVRRSDGEAVYAMVDGWAVIAESDAVVADFEAARGEESLADTEAWQEATDDLPEDALVRGFVNGDALTEAAAAEGASAGASLFSGRRVPSFGFALRAEEDGLHFDGSTTAAGDESPEPYEAALPDELPAGALAYVSWSDAAESLRTALRRAGDQNEDVDRYVASAELALGVSLERDVFPLLEGEGALAVYADEAAGGMPAIVLALGVEDDAAALATLDRIVERASDLLGAVERTGERRIGGVTVRTVSSDAGEVLYGAADGKLVVASASGPLEAIFAGGGETLSDDAAYAEARAAAEAPDETVGFAYANVDAILAAFAGEAPAEARENLEPLGGIFFHGSRDGDETALSGFVAVD